MYSKVSDSGIAIFFVPHPQEYFLHWKNEFLQGTFLDLRVYYFLPVLVSRYSTIDTAEVAKAICAVNRTVKLNPFRGFSS